MTVMRLGCRVGLVLLCLGQDRALAQGQPDTNANAGEVVEGPGSEEYTREVRAAVEAYNRDDFTNARKHFARAHELRPSARTWRGLGTTAFELKFYEDAVRELSFALEDRRGALTDKLRSETDLTLRVAQRRLRESKGEHEVAISFPVTRKEPDLQPSAAEPAPPAPAAAVQPANTDEAAGLGTQRIAALAVGALGVVGVGIGAGFGLKSMAKGRTRDRLCPENGSECTPEGAAAANDAITAGDISTVAWAIGGVAIAGGVVLWLTGGPGEDESGAKVEVGLGGVRLKAAF